MKKVLSILLVALLVFTMAACGDKNDGGGDNNDNNNIGSGSNLEGNKDKDKDANDSSSSSSSSSNNNTKSTGNVSGKDMENAIAGYLSAIGGPSSITLCGGQQITFEPTNEYFAMWGDSWEITSPDKNYEDLMDSIESQLADYGFTKGGGLLGYQFTKRVGVQSVGLIVANDSGKTTLYMTHAPNCYTAAYVAEQEAIMPKIIPASTALEVLPDNFLITWKLYYGTKYTVARKDGSWLYVSDGSEEETPWGTYYYAAILQSDGSFKYYTYTNSDTKPRERDYFVSSSDTVEETLMEQGVFDNPYGDGGMNDNGSLSTWLQMSKDYVEGKSYSFNMRFAISNSMTLKGTEVIAGRNCDVVTTGGGAFSEVREFAYDPTTGVLFRYGVEDYYDNTLENKFIIVEYDDNPATLGNFSLN